MVLQNGYRIFLMFITLISTTLSHANWPSGLSTKICFSETYQPIYLKSEERECVFNTNLEIAFINQLGSDPRLMPIEIVKSLQQSCKKAENCYSCCENAVCLKKGVCEEKWMTVKMCLSKDWPVRGPPNGCSDLFKHNIPSLFNIYTAC